MTHIIKVLIEITILSILYCISCRQDGRITVLEERAKGQDILKARGIQVAKQKEQSFKDKIKKEEQRMNDDKELIKLYPPLSRKTYNQKVKKKAEQHRMNETYIKDVRHFQEINIIPNNKKPKRTPEKYTEGVKKVVEIATKNKKLMESVK